MAGRHGLLSGALPTTGPCRLPRAPFPALLAFIIQNYPGTFWRSDTPVELSLSGGSLGVQNQRGERHSVATGGAEHLNSQG